MPSDLGRRSIAILISIGAASISAACSSGPSRLYQLSVVIGPSQLAAADASAARAATSPRADRPGRGPLVGVSVTIPEYLDRLDIVERTNSNELKPIYSAQWGESLAVTASRAFAQDLGALLPAADVVMFPSRAHRDLDYQITLDLMHFESDSTGQSTLAGRWSISDSSGTERASGRLLRSDTATPGNYAEMASAMSRNLASASSEIASAFLRLGPPSAKRERADR